MTSTQAPEPALQSVVQVAGLLRQTIFQWRVGADHVPGLQRTRELLTPRLRLDVEGAARGEAGLPQPITTLAARAHALLQSATAVDEACGAWSRTGAVVGNSAMDVAEARAWAIRDQNGVRARELWKGTTAAVKPVAAGEVATASRALAGWLPKDGFSEGAREFLDATRDLWEDALEFATRRHRAWLDVPQTLLHAQLLNHAPPDDVIPTAASRHVARALVEGWVRHLPALRRVHVRPMAGVPGFASVGDDGAPRIAWHERRGVMGLLELGSITLEGCLMALVPGAAAAVSTLGQLMMLGLLAPPVMRKALQLSREDAARVRRQAGLVMMRQARIHAAMALANPTCADEAMDPLQSATRSDPDVVDAVALTAPWPHPGPLLGPLALEHAHPWRVLMNAGALCRQVRDAWDEDFCMREVFQTHALETLRTSNGDVGVWGARLGLDEKTSWKGLAGWLEEVLA